MIGKVTIILIACLVASSLADSQEKDAPKIQVTIPPIKNYAPRPTAAYGDSDEKGSDKYQFAYKVKAGGPVKKYGDKSGESYSKGETAEFGHAESRDYGKTNGKYFVQLPDGRLQTVEYYVNGDSGFVAKVSYDGSTEKYAARSPAY